MSPRPPRLYRDRTPVSDLDEDVRLALHELGVIYSNSAVVQFVGVIPTSENVYAFLPIGMNASLENMKMVMGLLAQLQRPSTAFGIDLQYETNARPRTVSTALHLFEDYLAYGFYEHSETTIRSSRGGKPLWSRTVSQEQPIWVNGNAPVYERYIVRQTRSSESHVLRCIQEVALREIWGSLGWWLKERVNHAPSFSSRPHRWNRGEFVRQLRMAQRVAYDERSLRLAELLIAYFEELGAVAGPHLPIGVVLFEHVWEHILREVILDVQLLEYGRIEYVPRNLSQRVVGYSLRPDIIAHDIAGRTLILDAKYYSAQDASTLPGQSDIVKQLAYAMELRSRKAETKCVGAYRNCFVFPALESGSGPWQKIRFANAETQNVSAIECHYVSTESVIRWYLNGEKASISELLGAESPVEL